MNTTPSPSRRTFLRASAGMGAILAASGASACPYAAVRVRSGFVADPSTYYEVLEPVAKTGKPPMVLIHGGAITGSCYMATADGRPGWAPFFAAQGHQVVVPDWAGIGRSGYIPYDDLSGETVVKGLGKVLATLDRPAIVMTHSMSGPFGWKLLERFGDRIDSLVAIAPGGPANVSAPTEFLSSTPDYVEVRLAPGAPVLKISRKLPFVPERGWATKKAVGSSTRFPRDHLDSFLASLTVIPPRLLLERVNYENSALRVTDTSGYRGKRVALVIGTNDADHTAATDKPIVDWLNDIGARAEFIPLGERGIQGNGHMMMMESNSDQLAAGIAAWLQTGKFTAPAS